MLSVKVVLRFETKQIIFKSPVMHISIHRTQVRLESSSHRRHRRHTYTSHWKEALEKTNSQNMKRHNNEFKYSKMCKTTDIEHRIKELR